MFNGSIVALITPFKNDQIDEAALAGLVRHHLEHGTHGIVPVGTTGESPVLSQSEHQRVVEIVVSEVSGAVPVIAGAGSNNTAQAVALHQHAAKAGADAALHVMGYYNRPGPEGIYQHFAAVNAANDLPILVYNVPPRCAIDIEPETMARLATLNNVIGVKDATKDLSRSLREAVLIEKDFCFLSGEDPTAVAYNAQGGQGCISVVANVAPALSSEMQNACASGDYRSACAIQKSLVQLNEALYLEPSPAGVKYAASLLGLAEADCRLPIVEPGAETKRAIRAAMENLELIQIE